MPVRVNWSPLESVTVPLVPVPVCPDVTVTPLVSPVQFVVLSQLPEVPGLLQLTFAMSRGPPFLVEAL
jgi:hypothetical protein